jgi:hypothetical protein
MTHHFAVTALLHHQHAHVENFIKKRAETALELNLKLN